MSFPTLYCTALIDNEYAKGIFSGVCANNNKYTVHFWDGRVGYYDTLEHIQLNGTKTNRVKAN